MTTLPTCTIWHGVSKALDSTYYQILKIHPNINERDAQVISEHIVVASNKYNLDKYLLVALMAQESMFNNSKIRHHQDYGILQVNIHTARAYRFDLQKITSDLGYSVDSGAKVLSEFKKSYQKKEPKNWWTRYNSSVNHHRKQYKKSVCKFYIGQETCEKK